MRSDKAPPFVPVMPATGPARIRRADGPAIAEAASLIQQGKLVAFPTETVYGLGGNALDDRAVAAIFAVKARPRFNPLIVHVRNKAHAEELVLFNTLASRLAETFWPGGLTLVLPRREDCGLSLLASAGLPTAAVRAPAHPVAQALLDAARIPIAAPSANRAGRISPTTAQHVAEELGDRVDLILDGGPSPLGIESTVIGFSAYGAVLLRPGAVPRGAIEPITGPLREPESFRIESPGRMASHYAPESPLRLDARSVEPGEALLAFGKDVPRTAGPMCNLSEAGDLEEAAANLFAMLRLLDRSGASCIAVMPIPDHGLGEAINDRLRRAAAPRNGAEDGT